ncbi:MAG: hypothetical protein LBL01_00160, partial [Bifidobacteriaceae bacterium]|nr:hypothetical protein [Bifidobacteriaceae bacterium]
MSRRALALDPSHWATNPAATAKTASCGHGTAAAPAAPLSRQGASPLSTAGSASTSTLPVNHSRG